MHWSQTTSLPVSSTMEAYLAGDPDPGEIRADSQGKAGDQLSYETSPASCFRGLCCREGMPDGFHTGGVTVEAEGEDPLRGGAGGKEGVTVGEVDVDGEGDREGHLSLVCRGHGFDGDVVLGKEGRGASEAVDDKCLILHGL